MEGCCTRGPILPHVHKTDQLDQIVLACTDMGLTGINQNLQQVPWIPHNVR